MNRFQQVQENRALVPGHVVAAPRDVVSLQRGQRHELDVVDFQAGRKRPIVCGDAVEHAFRIVAQIHFVDGDDNVANTEQRHDETVSTGLRQHAIARIDQNHRHIAVRRTRRHVARVLLVSGRVRDNELAFRRGEIAIRHVDGDALLALCLQAVNEQGEVDVIALGARHLAVALQCIQLIFI